jgi:exopolysaccharide/PEP-CTERM locus tyrosine autokinase
MSRIEKALEKAARLKSVSVPGEIATSAAMHGAGFDSLLDVEPLPVDSPFLVGAGELSPAVNEEYNRLRSLVVALAKGDTFRNALVVTSTASEEGKTLTALNMSIALAREYDYTVLLVDTDLRRPSVHRYLGIQPEVGLIQCLRGEVPISQALVKTGIGKLVVLPAGGVVSDPVELLSSNRMREIVWELKNRYPERFVIFDSPPSLGFADAQVLSKIVDGIIFVVREGVVNEKQFRRAIDSFGGVNLLGVVLNDSCLSAAEMNYYSYG